MKNKKAQFSPYPQQGEGLGLGRSGTGVHWLFILGVLLFILPFFGPVIHIKFPGWISKLGFVLLVLGLILSIFKNTR